MVIIMFPRNRTNDTFINGFGESNEETENNKKKQDLHQYKLQEFHMYLLVDPDCEHNDKTVSCLLN